MERKFHIEAEVKICLQRIDEVLALPRAEQQPVHSPAAGSYTGVMEVQAEPTSHTHTAPLSWSKLSLDTEPLSPALWSSAQSLLTGMCHVGSEGDMGFVEPIEEEDFLSDTKDSRTDMSADLSTSSRRMGRMRKRPTCPCCVSGTEADALSFCGTSAEEQTLLWARLHKKRGRPKGSKNRADCLRSKKKKQQKKCWVSDAPACDSLDSAEEQTGSKRLKFDNNAGFD